jgi:hypothetical protein
MIIKPEVDMRGVHPVLWFRLAWLDKVHELYTGDELTVTSLRRPFVKGKVSRHAALPPPHNPARAFLDPRQWDEFMCIAADLRRWSLDGTGRLTAETFCKYIQNEHGDEIGVVLEPEWLTEKQLDMRGGIYNVSPHVHVQLKQPIKWGLWQ